jgi:hypothetical protein
MRTNFIKDIKEKIMRTKFIREKFMKKTIGVFAVSAVLVMLGLILTCENTLYKNEAKKAAPKTEEKETGGYYTPPTVLPPTIIYTKVIKSDDGNVVLTIKDKIAASINTLPNTSGAAFNLNNPKEGEEYDYWLTIEGDQVSHGTVQREEKIIIEWIFTPEIGGKPSEPFAFTATQSGGYLVFEGDIIDERKINDDGVKTDDEDAPTLTIPPLGGGSFFAGNGEESEEENEEPEEEIKVISLTLNETTLELEKGETFTLIATIETEPAGENVEIHWNSNKPIIASVENGVVTAKKEGEATIWAKAGSQTASCTVTVPLDPGLYIGESSDPVDLSLAEGETVTIAKALAWINANGAPEGQYTILLGENETEETSVGYEIKGDASRKNLKITLRGMSSDAENPVTITKDAAGPLFTVYGSTINDLDVQDVPELILKDITLKGYASNNSALVVVGKVYTGSTYYKGKLTMKDGSRITGNTNSATSGGGGVYIHSNSTFTMEDGSIDNNQVVAANTSGGGVYAVGTFTMSGGTIADNTCTRFGGGVNATQFTMSGGTISGNKSVSTSTTMGGGIYSTQFTMSGGLIANNESKYGGGVVVPANAANYFTMEGGSIEGNRASTAGAAVCQYNATNGTFTKTGGVIYGVNPADATKANKGTDGATVTIHAIAVGSGNIHWYDLTADETVNLSSKETSATGWDTAAD